MNWIIWSLVGIAALLGLASWVIRCRSRDIEEVILQGRPVLWRCGKLRVAGKASGCSQCDPSVNNGMDAPP